MVRFRQAGPKQRALYIGAVVIPVVLIGVLLLKPARNDTTHALPDAGQVQAASGTQPVSAVAPAVHAAPQAEGKAAGAGMAQPLVPAKPGTIKGAEIKPGVKKAGDQIKHPTAPSKPKATESSHKGVAPAGAASGAEQIKEAYIAITCKEGTQLFVDGAEKGKAQLGDARKN